MCTFSSLQSRYFFSSGTQRYMEKGQASEKGGPFPILTHQPLPWNHFLARPNSSQSNVQIDHTAKYASALQASYFPVCSTHVHML